MSGLEPPTKSGQREPSPVPDSTLARNFSEQLDGVFNLGGELPDLEQSVEDKRQVILTRNQELQALEAKLQATQSKIEEASGGNRVPSGTSQPRKDVREVFPQEASASVGAPAIPQSSGEARKPTSAATAQDAAGTTTSKRA